MSKTSYWKTFLITLFAFCTVATSVYANSWGDRGGVIYSPSRKYSGNWRKLSSSEEDSVKQLINIINSSKLGVELIDKARLRAAKDTKRLEDVIKSGDVSVTDTTLVRKFSPDSPQSVRFETRSKVYIDKSHNTKNAVLDLIHELTHYIYKEPFNPYLGEFSLSSFLEDTIQGKGGEVDAFLVECKIGREIYGLKSVSAQCQNILDGLDFSRELAVKEFYKLGEHYHQFKKHALDLHIREDLIRHVSDEQSSLISSAWSKPYPVAVIEEFKEIMTKVCQNDLKRMTYLKESNNRSIASSSNKAVKAKSEFDARCRAYVD